jgi:hypothetical protein
MDIRYVEVMMVGFFVRWSVLSCVFHRFCSLQGMNSSQYSICGVKEIGGGATHVCLAHSFVELMMVFIIFCVLVHFLR